MPNDTCWKCDCSFQVNDIVPRVLPCGHIYCTHCIDSLPITCSDDSSNGSDSESYTSARCPWCCHPFKGTGAEQPVSGFVTRWLNSLALAVDDPDHTRTRKHATNFSVDLYLKNLKAEGLRETILELTSDISDLLLESREQLAGMSSVSTALRDRIKELKKRQRKIRQGISTIRSHGRELINPRDAVHLCSAIQNVSDNADQQEQLLRHWTDKMLDDQEIVMQTEDVRRMLSGTRGCYAVFRYPAAITEPTFPADQNNSASPLAGAEATAGATAGAIAGATTTSSRRVSTRAAIAADAGAVTTAPIIDISDSEESSSGFIRQLTAGDGREASRSDIPGDAVALVEEQDGPETEEEEEEDEKMEEEVKEEECHYAKLTIDGKYLLLHSLHYEKTRPADMVEELVHSDLMRTVSPSGSVVFLDVAWCHREQGRVYIRLEGDTVWSRHFMAMCAGQCRASFVGTKLDVRDSGKLGERLNSILPSSCNTRTSALVDDDQVPFGSTCDIEPGLLSGNPSTESTVLVSSSFSVYMRHWPGYESESSIGKVVGGLAVLQGGLGLVHPMNITDTGILLNVVS